MTRIIRYASRPMSKPHERLADARRSAGYETAADAARALGIPEPSYVQHENGSRGLSRAGSRYARFFRVSLDWLLTGRGTPKTTASAIPVMGKVGAGARVELTDDAEENLPADIYLPGTHRLCALQVMGDSQWPRYQDGEFVLYDPDPILPATLIGQWAVVQTFDGRKLVKMLQPGNGENRWRLESHNAPPENNVELMGAWRILGLLPASASRPPKA